jgi:Tfp pilus assembly protein PilO
VSGVANLSRIVTLHDFTLAPQDGPEHLAMTIQAKTYRYRESEEEADASASAKSDAQGAQDDKDKQDDKDAADDASTEATP